MFLEKIFHPDEISQAVFALSQGGEGFLELIYLQQAGEPGEGQSKN
ncbi:MAG: hypothetical protein NTW80_02565 [Deltaproteobacteria bacterium]|nr:hypothetical protein [Deltaproteobacteria bacterium]